MDKKKSIVLSLLLIALGTGWFMTEQSLVPGVDWAWVLGLGVVGVLALAMGGINKVTIVVGPFLIIASFLSILRQTGRLTIDTEVPILVIIAGALMLMSVLLPLPDPVWRSDSDEGSQ